MLFAALRSLSLKRPFYGFPFLPELRGLTFFSLPGDFLLAQCAAEFAALPQLPKCLVP